MEGDMKSALTRRTMIDGGRLYDIVPQGSEFPVSEDFQWVAVTNDVSQHTHIFNGSLVVLKSPRTITELEKEASNLAKENLAKIRADIFPDVIAFLATLQGAPLSIKNAASLAAAEKAKVKA